MELESLKGGLFFSSQKGFTLLEVLISILVLSVGLLGVAGVQLKSMQSAQVSYQRSIASLAAQDAAERLWVGLGRASNECPDPQVSIENEWRGEWSSKLPDMEAMSGIENNLPRCEYTITVAWRDERFVKVGGGSEDVSLLEYFIQLPGQEP